MTDEDRVAILARFRAAPGKVRTSLRRTKAGWRAAVSLHGGFQYTARSKQPMVAMMAALRRAEADECPGIDLGLQWTYEHPWGAAGVKAREELGL
jgi:hypothetical protein